MSTFRESVDRWFDKLAESSDPALPGMLTAAQRHPTKHNVAGLRAAVVKLADTELRSAILTTLDTLRSFAGRSGEFRYTYHSYPKFVSGIQVSAAGELFSMVRQAVTYHAAENALVRPQPQFGRKRNLAN